MTKLTCSQCGDTFQCANDQQQCWCTKFRVSPFSIDKDCLCFNCLSSKTRDRISVLVEAFKKGETSNPVAGLSLHPLMEGIDYYIENGLWVFTGWYHLKKGKCCGSGCRHCPYDHVNVRK